jgi:hypothetical protein
MAKAAGTATMEKVGQELDRLYEALEKRGELPELAGKALNAYGLYAMPAALISGGIVYDQAKKWSRQSVLEKALKRRQQQRFLNQPPEVYAIPAPVPTDEPGE